ncbi:MAG: thiamine-phosphate kinase [Pseudomonadales bacterium]
MSLGEFELISKYFLKACSDPDLIVANGDDAAIVRSHGNLAVAADTLVAGVHFPENADAALIARRAMRVNLSDMAAMGAKPRWFTLSLTMPYPDPAWLERFSQGLFSEAERFNCHLIGGDTTKGPLNIANQMLGEIAQAEPCLTRSGANPGDLLVVTGTIGDAGAALGQDLCVSLDQASERDYLFERYWLPEPRVEFALRCRHLIHAALDISDGLLADAGHICRQSGVDARIHLDALPLSTQAVEFWGKKAALRAIVAGDDYELCMAVSRQCWDELQTIARELDIPVSILGEFCDQAGIAPSVSVLDNHGQPIAMVSKGYNHF